MSVSATTLDQHHTIGTSLLFTSVVSNSFAVAVTKGLKKKKKNRGSVCRSPTLLASCLGQVSLSCVTSSPFHFQEASPDCNGPVSLSADPRPKDLGSKVILKAQPRYQDSSWLLHLLKFKAQKGSREACIPQERIYNEVLWLFSIVI